MKLPDIRNRRVYNEALTDEQLHSLTRPHPRSPAQYLLMRAEAVHNNQKLPVPYSDDWLEYVKLVMPQDLEIPPEGDKEAFSREQVVMRLCLAAAIAEDSELVP